jgi:pyruvate dehydrogenase E2 component (dihydrolipoamide acetyltransferase)
MADAMERSAFTAPHVTEWVDVDVSASMRLLERLRVHPDFADVRIGPLTLAAAALVRAARRHPGINATFDAEAGEIVRYPEVALGIAAATPRGLVVPTIKRAESLSLPALAAALNRLTDQARAGTTSLDDLTGGTITITNVGVFGVDGGTPILNPGEAAILCLGRVTPRAWVVDGSVVAREVMELTLSFDHRLVDGALGSTVLAEVAEFLHDPTYALAFD